MAGDIKILSQSEKTVPNDAGKFRLVIETRFMVGNDGPFAVQQDEATFDPQLQQTLVSAKAAALTAARGAFGG